MPVSGRLCHSLRFVMNYDVIDAGGAEGEAVVWMEGDGFQLGAVDFGGGGGWGGGGEGGEVFVDALAGVFDVAFFGGPDVEKVTVGAASEVFVFLGVEKTGGYAFFSSFGVELEIQAHFCGSHGAGPVFAAVADGKVEPGAVGEVGLAMAAFLCAPGWGGRLAGGK